MSTGFKFTDSAAGVETTDFDDVFVRRERFLGQELWTWSYNYNGQLGTNNRIARSSPVQTVSSGTNWRSVAVGCLHSAAIKTDGTLWGWGDNYDGSLATNNRIDRSSPVQTVSGGTNWCSISTAGSTVSALKTDGTLWLWGCNYYGQLGNNNRIFRSSPVQTVSAGTNWRSTSSSYRNTAAIKSDGTLWIWGDNYNGNLGTNNVIIRSSPVQTVSGGTNWCSVSLGCQHSAAIKTDGTLWAWGIGLHGSLGTNEDISRSSPVQTVSGGTNWHSVSLGCQHSAAIKTDGTLWVWGHNNEGQLGVNDTSNRSSPVQTVSGGTNWRSVSPKAYNTASIKTDGTLWLWGKNLYGQLGTNDTIDRSSPVQTVSGGTYWRRGLVGAALKKEEYYL